MSNAKTTNQHPRNSNNGKMSNAENTNQQPRNTHNRKGFMKRITRRGIIAAGGSVVGFATLAASRGVLANTMQPVKPETSKANLNGRFEDKVVLITGATSGIGKTTAEAFAREGAKVMFCGRRENIGRQVEAGIRKFGGEATYMRADVRDPKQVKAFVDAAVAKYGRLDIAFNNAGIAEPHGEIQDLAVEDYLDVMLTNAGGTWFSMKYEIPHMRRQGAGVIINMASVSGHRGFPILPHYGASKHAVIGMTKPVAVVNAQHNIRVNSISPLAVDTPQLRRSFEMQGVTYEQAAEGFVTPRVMTTDEMARAVMFLASDEATSVTGMDLDVTGGFLAGQK